jgi:hypothetical protein
MKTQDWAGGMALKAKSIFAALLTAGALAGADIGVGTAAPAAANVPVRALAAIQHGQWEIRSRDNPDANRSLCMSDAKILLQLRHPNNVCTRFVISDGPREATVQYSCAASGNGRTTLRVETPRLVQIDTQGIADQSPFAFSAEARRVGECAAPNSGVAARKISKPRLGVR